MESRCSYCGTTGGPFLQVQSLFVLLKRPPAVRPLQLQPWPVRQLGGGRAHPRPAGRAVGARPRSTLVPVGLSPARLRRLGDRLLGPGGP